MCVPFFRTPAHEQVFCQLYSIKADCLLHFGVFAAVLTLEKLLKAFDCLFALKLCFGLHKPQLILFALQCFSKKKTKNTSFGCSVSHTRNIILKRCDHLKIFLND